MAHFFDGEGGHVADIALSLQVQEGHGFLPWLGVDEVPIHAYSIKPRYYITQVDWMVEGAAMVSGEGAGVV